MSKWIKEENKIKWKDTVYDGLENAPKAFIGLFRGYPKTLPLLYVIQAQAKCSIAI
jgi:hypothetical protein